MMDPNTTLDAGNDSGIHAEDWQPTNLADDPGDSQNHVDNQ